MKRFFLDYHYHKTREEAEEKGQSGGEGDVEDVGMATVTGGGVWCLW